jgi:hypothetical protein
METREESSRPLEISVCFAGRKSSLKSWAKVEIRRSGEGLEQSVGSGCREKCLAAAPLYYSSIRMKFWNWPVAKAGICSSVGAMSCYNNVQRIIKVVSSWNR